jgi:hypothetical protein
MTTLREAAQQALEFCGFLWREVSMNDYADERRERIETALRAALEQPEQQEPVATVSQGQPGHLGWAPLPKRPDWMKT